MGSYGICPSSQVAEQEERIEIAEQRYLRALEIGRQLAERFPRQSTNYG